GPKIRTGELEASFQRLVRGRRVVLTAGPRIEPSDIEVSHQELVDTVRKGDRVLLDDGRIELAVREKADGRATCAVVRGGLLGERKGVSVPGRTPPLPALTDKDLADLKLAVELGVDYVALSFVRKPQDVVECRNHIASLGSTAPVIAKLEKVEAIRELGQILEVAGAVMVARGDLGVELKLGELPAVQKEVIDHANRAGVPVITATEMLESMVTSNRPTRAEASAADHRRQPQRERAAQDRPVCGGDPAAGTTRPGHRRHGFERHCRGREGRLRALGRQGRDSGRGARGPGRADQPPEGRDSQL